jgi:hypothetical protein
MQPGIFNLPAEAYHADPAPTPSLSCSIAKILVEQSPLHAWQAHPRLNPGFEREEDSRFDLGSAAHMMLLEKREDGIVVVNADDWRTKAAKEARDAARANGQLPVLERHYGDIVAMVESAKAYLAGTELAGILETGIAESTIMWQENDVWYRCRPDVITPHVILDYKSTASAEPEFITRQIGRMGYDIQESFYKRGVKAATGADKPFVFLFQEVTKPYACSLVGLSAAYQELGRMKTKRAIATWERCLKANDWPGYASHIIYAEPSAYNLADEEAKQEEVTQ